jgi:hypothetical protein
VHGINLIIEAARQIRGIGEQVPNARLSMATSGNMVPTGAILPARRRLRGSCAP